MESVQGGREEEEESEAEAGKGWEVNSFVGV